MPTYALFQPPPPQRVGGLDLAIRALEGYLMASGAEVLVDPDRASIQERRPDVVHFHGLWQPAFLQQSAWCRRNGIPYLVSPHGMLEPWSLQHKRWKKIPYFRLLERPFLRGAHALVATSEQEQKNLRSATGHHAIEVIPLAVDHPSRPDYVEARQALGWRPSERVLLYLSRVHPKKGLHYLVEALDEALVDGHDVRLVVVGDGPDPYASNVRTQAEGLRPHVTVDWVGGVWNDEKWRYLQGADLFCLPTHSENFGIAVLEACQVGTPVLTTTETPWGFLEDWGAAWICSPEIGSVRTSLHEFLTAPSWTLAQRDDLAHRTHDRFSRDLVARRYLDIYDGSQSVLAT